MGNRGRKGEAKRGKRFGLLTYETYIKFFEINSFLMRKQPLTIPRTDEELAELLRDELDDNEIDVARIRKYRARYNEGTMTMGIVPKHLSKEYVTPCES